ncbi:MAG: hypothetical protein HY674_06355, partial [Chloroflexi bacterium]|nr:hypothetical protein [Chloroflexota bacterium]
MIHVRKQAAKEAGISDGSLSAYEYLEKNAEPEAAAATTALIFSYVFRLTPPATAIASETRPFSRAGNLPARSFPFFSDSTFLFSASGLSIFSSRSPSASISVGLNPSRHVFSCSSAFSAKALAQVHQARHYADMDNQTPAQAARDFFRLLALPKEF